MTYQEYMDLANSCTTPEEADELINMAADDDTLSARKYFNIRYAAIESAYNN